MKLCEYLVEQLESITYLCAWISFLLADTNQKGGRTTERNVTQKHMLKADALDCLYFKDCSYRSWWEYMLATFFSPPKSISNLPWYMNYEFLILLLHPSPLWTVSYNRHKRHYYRTVLTETVMTGKESTLGHWNWRRREFCISQDLGSSSLNALKLIYTYTQWCVHDMEMTEGYLNFLRIFLNHLFWR